MIAEENQFVLKDVNVCSRAVHFRWFVLCLLSKANLSFMPDYIKTIICWWDSLPSPLPPSDELVPRGGRGGRGSLLYTMDGMLAVYDVM